MQWLFWVINQSWKGFWNLKKVLVFGKHLMYDLFVTMVLIEYSIYWQSFNVRPLFFLKIYKKMCY